MTAQTSADHPAPRIETSPTSSVLGPESTGASKSKNASADRDVEDLHDRCGVYTSAPLVAGILDRVGWRSEVDLAGSRLLEPAAGDGAFVAEAASRLARSARHHGRTLTASAFAGTIAAWELHPVEAGKARARVEKALTSEGVSDVVARCLSHAWIRTADFLLASDVGRYSHVVGNPPYVRWSKIPEKIKDRYEGHLPRELIGGDLLLPFLHLSLSALEIGGTCGILCSDRWLYMRYAESFRREWLPLLRIRSNDEIDARHAFVEKVDAYPTVLVADRLAAGIKSPTASRRAGRTLLDAGYVVKVGPALGCSAAYVLQPDQNDVESDLLRPWIDGSDIEEGSVRASGCRVVAMYDERGLVDPTRHPLLLQRLQRFEKTLASRSIVQSGAPWYRPIDRVRAVDWIRPKLVVPELAKVPRLALDATGSIPSHGVYAIFAPDDDLGDLLDRLRNGGLARRLEGVAPRVKGGYVRCYKRFLEQILL